MDLRPLGDRVLLLRDVISSTWKSAQSLADALKRDKPDWIEEIVPAFDTVAILFDPLLANEDVLNITGRWAQGVFEQGVADSILDDPRTITIPVRYGGKSGPDLNDVARRLNSSAEELIHLHSSARYHVLAIGFLPGFGYLGGLPKSLVLPRRDSVRPRVPAGSVAIGGPYAGVYPFESPGGWHLIGQTSLPLFNEQAGALLRVGDRVRFEAERVDP